VKIFLVPNFQLGMPSATLRVANQKELITIVFGERSLRSKEEGIPKRSLGTRNAFPRQRVNAINLRVFTQGRHTGLPLQIPRIHWL